jgi:hypothetical protein
MDEYEPTASTHRRAILDFSRSTSKRAAAGKTETEFHQGTLDGHGIPHGDD